MGAHNGKLHLGGSQTPTKTQTQHDLMRKTEENSGKTQEKRKVQDKNLKQLRKNSGKLGKKRKAQEKLKQREQLRKNSNNEQNS